MPVSQDRLAADRSFRSGQLRRQPLSEGIGEPGSRRAVGHDGLRQLLQPGDPSHGGGGQLGELRQLYEVTSAVAMIYEPLGHRGGAQQPAVGLASTEVPTPGEVLVRRRSRRKPQHGSTPAQHRRAEEGVEVAAPGGGGLSGLGQVTLEGLPVADVGHDAVDVVVDESNGIHGAADGLARHQWRHRVIAVTSSGLESANSASSARRTAAIVS